MSRGNNSGTGGKNYRDLRELSAETGLLPQDLKRVFRSVLRVAFRQGSVTIREFGRFEVRVSKPTRRRDIRTKRWIEVPERTRFVFLPSEKLMMTLNGKFRSRDIQDLNEQELREIESTVRAWNPKVGVQNPRPQR